MECPGWQGQRDMSLGDTIRILAAYSRRTMPWLDPYDDRPALSGYHRLGQRAGVGADRRRSCQAGKDCQGAQPAI